MKVNNPNKSFIQNKCNKICKKIYGREPNFGDYINYNNRIYLNCYGGWIEIEFNAIDIKL